MKTFTISLLALFFLAACNSSEIEMKDRPEAIKLSVDSVLTQWHLSAAEADFSSYMGAMDSLSCFIGTDAGENWPKAEFGSFCKPYFEKGSAWEFSAYERNIYLNEDQDIAWFDELLDTWMGSCRGSGVVEKVNNTWRIKHYVLSVLIPNEDIKAVVALKHKNDSLFRIGYLPKEN